MKADCNFLKHDVSLCYACSYWLVFCCFLLFSVVFSTIWSKGVAIRGIPGLREDKGWSGYHSLGLVGSMLTL